MMIRTGTRTQLKPKSSQAFGRNGKINLNGLYVDILPSDRPTEVWVSGHGHHTNSAMHTFMKLSPDDAIELGRALFRAGETALEIRSEREVSYTD